ncbi:MULTISPECIES: hypothetical protein [Stenotrophomonas]|uniref:hypothetical protein n=1 Tax=Stenotrophomonas TaxID=40323 RepID=UPI000AA9D161|nr:MULTISPECIES: hypothetical protein [Stenotrophomonas]MBH1410364.1 hypothetical protein [Stenotrophomonas maltophilia]MBH1746363.1 hypothetical protein [Stenotrophomonas maltophilia]MBH1863912.1 hypothetical protein [Stenotrophomonas maltophilia]MDH1389659.1 hypothetical protein [Stenotrophomonas sp. GD03701]MDH1392620.1 hypothetical protein [Stenotrophomonas sp. GD03702]
MAVVAWMLDAMDLKRLSPFLRVSVILAGILLGIALGYVLSRHFPGLAALIHERMQ